MSKEISNLGIWKYLLATGWSRWRRFKGFHLSTILGLTIGATLLVLLMTFPGAVSEKIDRLESRVPGRVPSNSLHVKRATEFHSFFYLERWKDKTIEIVAIDLPYGSVEVPGQSELIEVGDAVVSHGLGAELTDSERSKSLMNHLGADRILKVLSAEIDAEPEEFYAYVATSTSELLRMCRCAVDQLGLSTFHQDDLRSTGNLGYGYVFLIVLATILFVGILSNNLKLALSVLFDKERRLLAEINLLGAPPWMGNVVLAVGLIVDSTIALLLGFLLARPMGAFLSTSPSYGYKLPFFTLGYPSMWVSIAVCASLALLVSLSMREISNSFDSGGAIRAIQADDSKMDLAGVRIGLVGLALLSSVWFLSRFANSHTREVALLLGLGVIGASVGLARSSGIANRIISPIILLSKSATSFYLVSLMRINRRHTGVYGVLVGLVIAAGIITSYSAIAQGGDSFTLGKSFEVLEPSTAVVTGITASEAKTIERISNGRAALVQLAVGEDKSGHQTRMLLAKCETLRMYVVNKSGFQCSKGAPLLIDQTEFLKVSGTTFQPPPRENSVLTGYSVDRKTIGTIEVGNYSHGSIKLPGDIWLAGALIVVDPQKAAIDVDPRAQRWMYVSTKDIDIERIRDALVPSAVSDVRSVAELSVGGDRRQFRFFQSASLWFGLLLALLCGISLGLGAISEIESIRKNILAAVLIGAPRSVVYKAVIAAGVIRVAVVALFASLAATIAGLGYSRLTAAQEYGLAGPLYGFHWWFVAAIAMVSLATTSLIRLIVILMNSRSLEIASLQ